MAGAASSSIQDDLLVSRKQIFCEAEKYSKEKGVSFSSGLSEYLKGRENTKYLQYKMIEMWNRSSRTRARFFESNKKWLEGTVNLKKMKIGRPKKSFTDSSSRTKKRKTEELRERDSQELYFSAAQKLRAKGKRQAGRLVAEITKEPKLAAKLMMPEVQNLNISTKDALQMFVEADLTKEAYNIIRHYTKYTLPSYYAIQAEKKLTYPEKISVSETVADVPVPELLKHTFTRTILGLEQQPEGGDLDFFLKWGVDGSVMKNYRQKFSEDRTPDLASETHILQSSLVPLRLVANSGKIIWENPKPSSTKFCRPIRISCIKETPEVTLDELNRVEEETKSMADPVTGKVNLVVEGQTYHVNFNMMATMIDGKVCNAATNTTSTLRCYLCSSTSAQFNNLTLMKQQKVDEKSLSYGLSLLHARIRIFESLLHLSYRLPFKKWRILKHMKPELERVKRKIQGDFRGKLGMLVDIPRAGFGNTNDGNSSRKFFENIDVVTQITGLDKALLLRFKVILEVLSSGQEILFADFKEYCLKTAEEYIKLYPWNPMTPTMHKLLIHSTEIAQQFLLPMGQLSEEAAEARNKSLKKFREHNSRKMSRQKCLEDILRRLLLTSDPYLAMSPGRITSVKKTKPLMAETLKLLKSQDIDEKDSTSVKVDEQEDDENDEEEEEKDESEDDLVAYECSDEHQ